MKLSLYQVPFFCFLTLEDVILGFSFLGIRDRTLILISYLVWNVVYPTTLIAISY